MESSGEVKRYYDFGQVIHYLDYLVTGFWFKERYFIHEKQHLAKAQAPN